MNGIYSHPDRTDLKELQEKGLPKKIPFLEKPNAYYLKVMQDY